MELRTFVDVEGLTHQDWPVWTEYQEALGLLSDEYEAVYGGSRLQLLAALTKGAGVRIITGPAGVSFWKLASPEVQIMVVPDGYEMKERTNDALLWALELRVVPARAKQIVKLKHPERNEDYQRAQALVASLPTVDPLIEEEFSYEILKEGEAIDFLDSVEGLCALDWEWDPATRESQTLNYSDATRNVCVPVRTQDYAAPPSFRDDLRRAVERLIERNVPHVWHNGRSDLGTQSIADPICYTGRNVHDTIVLAYLAGEPQLGLKDLSRKLLGRSPIDYLGPEQTVDQFARYGAAGDTRNTYDLFVKLTGTVIERNGWELYDKIERPLVPVIASMERAGVPVSVPALLKEYREHVALEQGIRRSILESAGLDLSSDSGTRTYLHESIGYDPGTLDQRILSSIPNGEVDLVLFYRQHRTRRRNFLKRHILRWVEAGKPEDFRLYPSFNQAGSPDRARPKSAPRTGRLSSSDPNLQNQSRKLRHIFIPPRDCVWWSFDYQQLELNLAAALSGDREMLSALHRGEDLHDLFKQRLEQLGLHGLDRAGVVKPANFEQIYEGGADQLVKIIAKTRRYISQELAQELVDAHHQIFYGYHEWGRQQVQLAKERGYSETLFGRRRYLPELHSEDARERSHAERAAQNHVIQGTAADIVKRAMLRVVPVLSDYSAHMALQVHDELDGWVPVHVDLGGFQSDMVMAMQKEELPHNVRLKVDGGVGMSWEEAH